MNITIEGQVYRVRNEFDLSWFLATWQRHRYLPWVREVLKDWLAELEAK